MKRHAQWNPYFPGDLKAEAKKSMRSDAETQVIMIADKMATHGMVIEVIDLIKAAEQKTLPFRWKKR